MVGTAHAEIVGTRTLSGSPAVVLNKQIEFPLSVPVCAWCQPRPGNIPDARPLSHGICPRHLKAMRLQISGAGAPAPVLKHRRAPRTDSTALLSL
jgi:hypothetical protein